MKLPNPPKKILFKITRLPQFPVIFNSSVMKHNNNHRAWTTDYRVWSIVCLQEYNSLGIFFLCFPLNFQIFRWWSVVERILLRFELFCILRRTQYKIYRESLLFSQRFFHIWGCGWQSRAGFLSLNECVFKRIKRIYLESSFFNFIKVINILLLGFELLCIFKNTI